MNVKPLNIVFLAFVISIGAANAIGAEMTDEVIKLQSAGIDNDVILHFVQDSNSNVDLSADEIQKLEDAGVSSTVIVAMLDRSKELRDDPTKTNTASPAVPVAEPVQASVADNTDTSVATEVVAPATGQADISLFYEALTPYGTWSQDANNGWVWVPTESVRNTNWRPYANDGHWTWTDQGWYWESTSAYGWAAFHYGRWGYNAEHRWSWSPDNVWGPAWVDWRHSDNYVGWAPLPIGSRFEEGTGFSYQGREVGFDFHAGMEERDYAFVPSNAFLNVDLGVSFVHEDRRRNVYNETKVVNNTYVYNDNRVINNGISVAIISKATNRKIETVKLADANIAAGQPIRGEHRDANTISVYRPRVANKATVLPPAIAEHRKLATANPAAAKTTATKATPRNVAVAPKITAEAEKQSRQRLIEEKDKRKAGKLAPAEAKQSAPSAVATTPKAETPAEVKRAANQEAATERKANSEAAKEAQEKLREEKQAASKAPAAERPKAETPAEAKRAANQEAATERKTNAEAAKEAQERVREEKQAAPKQPPAVTPRPEPAAEAKRSANQEAATERKAAAEAKREESQESKEEKAKEKKDGQK